MRQQLVALAIVAVLIPAGLAMGQTRGHSRVRQVSHIHGASIQGSCDTCCDAWDPCAPPCCPRIIPTLLKGVGKFLDCLLPTGCGCCPSPCSGRIHGCDDCAAPVAPTCGCGQTHSFHSGGGEILSEPQLVPPQPVPEVIQPPKASGGSSSRWNLQGSPYRRSSARSRTRVTPRRTTPVRRSPTPAKPLDRVTQVKASAAPATLPAPAPVVQASFTKKTTANKAAAVRQPNPRLNFSIPVNPLR